MADLSTQQNRAIVALLNGDSIRNAAKAASIGERTLYRWLAEDDAFRHKLRDAESSALDAATRQLSVIASEAVTVLRDIQNDDDTPPNVRVSAARALLDSTMKMVEMRNFDERLRRLEEENQ